MFWLSSIPVQAKKYNHKNIHQEYGNIFKIKYEYYIVCFAVNHEYIVCLAVTVHR